MPAADPHGLAYAIERPAPAAAPVHERAAASPSSPAPQSAAERFTDSRERRMGDVKSEAHTRGTSSAVDMVTVR
jgi:hypothetical protein